jgi:tetratricopeptide (TPR) repeat protein
MKKFTGKIKDIFGKDDHFTFLVGAGISMDAPSKLPSARELVKKLVEMCSPKEYISEILSLESLRYELVVEHLKNIRGIDSNLQFMDFFEEVISPNMIHMFLANMIITGGGKHKVITTNYDYLIEFALKSLLPTDDQQNILPIITKDDFSQDYHWDPDKRNRYPVCKIHGSKKNIITGVDTVETLIADIASLGKNRMEGETFTIETFKKPLMNAMMKGQTLVVMGYSGSDDFDIGPLLFEIQNLKTLIWIDHSMGTDLELFHFNHNSAENKTFKSRVTKIENILSEIYRDTDFEVYLVKCNTLRLIKDYLDGILLNGITNKFETNIPVSPNSARFTEWIETVDTYKNIIDSKKYLFAGYLLQDLGKFNITLECYKRGLELVSESDQDLKSALLNNIGLIYKIKGDYDNALKYYREALHIDKQLEKLSGEAVILSNIGMIYHAKGDYDNALQHLRDALQIDEKLGDLQGKAVRLNNIGLIYNAQGDYEKAMQHYKEVLHIIEQFGELRRKATILNNIGLIYDAKGEYDNAMQQYQEALQIDEQLGDIWGKATRLNNIGEIYRVKGDYDNASKQYQEALQIYEQLGDLRAKATILNNIGLIYDAKRDYDNALQYYQEALQINEQLENLQGKAGRLNNIGEIYRVKGDDEKASKYYLEALQIYEQLGDLRGKATIFNNLGLIYDAKGDYDKALQYYQEALQIDEKLGDLRGKATIFNNLGTIFQSKGDYDNALQYYQEALQIDEKLGDLRGKATRLNNIGMIYDAQDDYENALQHYQEALLIADQLGDLSGKATKLYNIAVLYFDGLKDTKLAIKYMEMALQIYEKLKLNNEIEETQAAVKYLKQQFPS